MEELYKETGNITVFAQLPHTHLAGVEFYSKILRNNKEIEIISNNPYYDSNFQYVSFMQEEVVLKKVSIIKENLVMRNNILEVKILNQNDPFLKIDSLIN